MGRICKLCDRKFLIKDMIKVSSQQIKVQNLAIENSLKQQDDLKQEIKKEKDEHEYQINT